MIFFYLVYKYAYVKTHYRLEFKNMKIFLHFTNIDKLKMDRFRMQKFSTFFLVSSVRHGFLFHRFSKNRCNLKLTILEKWTVLSKRLWQLWFCCKNPGVSLVLDIWQTMAEGFYPLLLALHHTPLSDINVQWLRSYLQQFQTNLSETLQVTEVCLYL